MLFGLSVILFLAILTAGCASNRDTPTKRKSSRSQKSGKSRRSTRSKKSKRSKSSKSRRSKSSKSRKSSKSSRNSRRSSNSASRKNKKNILSASDRRVRAAILADKKAAQAASLKASSEYTTNSECEEQTHNITYTNIRVIPHEVLFKQIGGLKTIRIKNSTESPIVYMIKCSDNMLYSINPVYGSIGANDETSVNILRENGIIKNDKLILITAKQENEASPAQIFAEMYKNNSLDYNVNMVPLISRN